MTSTIPKLNVCLNDRARRYRPDNPMQNWRELGVHGTRDEIVAQYANTLALRYSRGDIRPSDLIETFNNVEPCRCPTDRACTTAVLEEFITTNLEDLTKPV